MPVENQSLPERWYFMDWSDSWAGDRDPRYDDFVVAADPQGEFQLARMERGRTGDVAEAKANALLMTAAPVMLALLRKFADFARDGGNFSYPPGSLQELEAAIALATTPPEGD